MAEQEGCKEIAKVEKFHEARYRALLEHVKNGIFFKRKEFIRWHCRNCGYVIKGHYPSSKCPSCHHGREHYEPLAENYL